MAPFFAYTDFSTMVTPALIVHGELDVPDYLTTRGVEWHMDPYVFGGEEKDLLIVKGAWHIFGGISGWDVKETGEDESVERVGVVCRMTGAWLESRLGGAGSDTGNGNGGGGVKGKAWKEACEALEGLDGLGMVESKGR